MSPPAGESVARRLESARNGLLRPRSHGLAAGRPDVRLPKELRVPPEHPTRRSDVERDTSRASDRSDASLLRALAPPVLPPGPSAPSGTGFRPRRGEPFATPPEGGSAGRLLEAWSARPAAETADRPRGRHLPRVMRCSTDVATGRTGSTRPTSEARSCARAPKHPRDRSSVALGIVPRRRSSRAPVVSPRGEPLPAHEEPACAAVAGAPKGPTTTARGLRLHRYGRSGLFVRVPKHAAERTFPSSGRSVFRDPRHDGSSRSHRGGLVGPRSAGASPRRDHHRRRAASPFGSARGRLHASPSGSATPSQPRPKPVPLGHRRRHEGAGKPARCRPRVIPDDASSRARLSVRTGFPGCETDGGRLPWGLVPFGACGSGQRLAPGLPHPATRRL
jgi:hypothetical protein